MITVMEQQLMNFFSRITEEVQLFLKEIKYSVGAIGGGTEIRCNIPNFWKI